MQGLYGKICGKEKIACRTPCMHHRNCKASNKLAVRKTRYACNARNLSKKMSLAVRNAHNTMNADVVSGLSQG